MSIYERQNKKGMILLLKLQRCLYSKAKVISEVKTVIILIITCIFLILTSVLNNESLNIWSIFIGTILTLTGYLLGLYVNSIKKLAAGIQQKFDLYVLQIDKNNAASSSILLPDIPNNETIIALEKRYKNKHLDRLENWYNDYSNKTNANQILSCQKENIRWDRKLRIKWLIMLSAAYLLIFISIVITGIKTNSVFTMCTVFAWFLPVIECASTSIICLAKDIIRLSNIKTKLDAADELNYEEDKLFEKVSILQATIYEHRVKSYLVPNLIYKIFRKTMQEESDAISKEEEYDDLAV